MPLTIFRRGKIWHYRGSVAKRRLRGTTDTADKTTAQRIANEVEARHWKGSLDGPGSVIGFAGAANLYLDAGKSDRFIAKIAAYWKDTPVREIKAGAIRQSALTLYPDASGATRNRQVITPTQAVINHVAALDLTPWIKVKRFAIEKREKTPATWPWVTAFMSAANPHLAALACFMFLTGARISEALSLTWEDVDLRAASALITQTKIGAERRARLPWTLVASIGSIPGPREGRVFGYSSRQSVQKPWDRVCKRAGIKPLSPHCCRHGFATGLLDQGVNPKTVAVRGGWKSARHVFETYAHDVASEDVTDLLVDTQGTQRPMHKSKVIGE